MIAGTRILRLLGVLDPDLAVLLVGLCTSSSVFLLRSFVNQSTFSLDLWGEFCSKCGAVPSTTKFGNPVVGEKGKGTEFGLLHGLVGGFGILGGDSTGASSTVLLFSSGGIGIALAFLVTPVEEIIYVYIYFFLMIQVR